MRRVYRDMLHRVVNFISCTARYHEAHGAAVLQGKAHRSWGFQISSVGGSVRTIVWSPCGLQASEPYCIWQMSGRPVAVPMLYSRYAFGALLLDWAECRWDCIVDLTPPSASCCLTSSPQQPVCYTALCEGRHYSRRFSPTISILWHGHSMVCRCFTQS